MTWKLRFDRMDGREPSVVIDLSQHPFTVLHLPSVDCEGLIGWSVTSQLMIECELVDHIRILWTLHATTSYLRTFLEKLIVNYAREQETLPQTCIWQKRLITRQNSLILAVKALR